MVTSGGYLVDYGVESKNPLLIKIGTGLKYGSTTMKYLVTPDEIKDYQIYNEIVPKLFQVEPAEGETK
jgi:hypothetical protein